MPKIEPETFREKLYLLVIDKVVIGALIAIAFIVYDQWKTQEVRRYTDTQEEVQLAFRRAEYVKQLIPIVLASE
jgi:predicted Co/Zn/Cd cation transporter (cation efflux family)